MEGKEINKYIAHCSYLHSLLEETSLRWSEEELKTYIMYLHQDTIVDNFFSGLLFEAFLASEAEVLSGKIPGFGNAPTLDSWQEAIEELFIKDFNLEALVKASKLRLFGEPLDVWIALPYPYPSTRVFGILEGKSLDFRKHPLDKGIALRWWIDQVIDRWNTLTSLHPGHNARLCGFAWTKGSLDHNDEELIAQLHAHVQAKNMKLIWCTNYGAIKAGSGKELGFDSVFLRPTYMNTEARNESWLQATGHYSAYIVENIIVWGDERVSSNQLVDFLNVGSRSYTHASQIFELNGKSIYEYYKNNDPKYVYLYAYIKNAYDYIPT